MHGNEFHLFLPAIKSTRTSAIHISVRISLTALGKFLIVLMRCLRTILCAPVKRQVISP